MGITQYDNVASDYDAHMQNNKSNLDDYIDLLQLQNTKLNILEIGSGSGIDAKNILDNYSNISSYLGIDNSDGMDKIARERVNDERAEFVVADMDTFEYPTERFNLVYGTYAIHYTQNLKKLMSNIYKALVANGIFVLKDSHPLVGFLRKESKDYSTKENVDFPIAGGGNVMVNHPTFTIEEYITSAISAGFSILKLEEQMGSQSEVLGINGYKIPTKLVLVLKK